LACFLSRYAEVSLLSSIPARAGAGRLETHVQRSCHRCRSVAHALRYLAGWRRENAAGITSFRQSVPCL